MSLCKQTAVHIYNTNQSFLVNAVGFDVVGWFRRAFGPPSSGWNQFAWSSYDCVHGYLPVGMIGGAGFTLVAHLIALTFWIFLSLGRSRRVLSQLIAGWALTSLAGMGNNFYGLCRLFNVIDPQSALRVKADEVLSMYLLSIPIQFAFNAILSLIIPALLIVAIKQLIARRKNASS